MANTSPSSPTAASTRSTTGTPSTCPSRARSSPTSWPSPPTPRRPSARASTSSEADAGGRDCRRTTARPGRSRRRSRAVRVDAEGLAHRVISVPVPQGNYSGLTATAGALLWLDSELAGVTGEGRASLEDKNAAPSLVRFDLAKRQTTTIVDAAGQLPALRRRRKGRGPPGQADPRRARRRQGRRGVRPAGQGGPRPHPGAAGSAQRLGPGLRRGLAAPARLLLDGRHGRPGLGLGPRPLPPDGGTARLARRPRGPAVGAPRRAGHLPRLRPARSPSPRTAATARAASARIWRSPARAGRSPASSRGSPPTRWPPRR